MTHVKYQEIIHQTDPGIIASEIKQLLTDVLDNNAPIIFKQIKKSQPRFMSVGTKENMIERDEAQYQHSQSGSLNNARQYKQLKNNVNRQLDKDYKSYITCQLDKDKDDTNKQYRTVR